MGKIWITSDWHFNHNKPFIYQARGFDTIADMNNSIIEKHNKIVSKEDTVYVLGDCLLGDNKIGIECLKQLNGQLHIIRGNHCSKERIELYRRLPNVVEVANSFYFSYDGYKFYLSHYPTITTRADAGKPLKKCLVNLCGHSHTKDPFEDWGIGMIYHCEVDAHDCAPVRIDKIITDLKQKISDHAD